MEWYDPVQVTTRDGALVITMDSVNTTQAGLTPGMNLFSLSSNKKPSHFNLLSLFLGSTAPFTLESNHGLGYRSGMVQTWNKFCFTTGYVEVSVTLPGPNQNAEGYVSFFFLFWLFLGRFLLSQC